MGGPAGDGCNPRRDRIASCRDTSSIPPVYDYSRPTLVPGEEDHFARTQTIDRQPGALRHRRTAATLRIFEGQEHNAMVSLPKEFAATVSSFLLELHR